jgi:hypothetical protein
MLRNDLITQLSRQDNDPVSVDVNGILIDVERVTVARDDIVIVLNPEDLSDTLRKLASGQLPLPAGHALPAEHAPAADHKPSQ